MLYAALASTFVLSEEALANSPSRKAGVSEDLETQLRLYGCELVQEAGCLLKLPQAVMATGQVLLHRFYGKRSMTEHDVKVQPCLRGWGGERGCLHPARSESCPRACSAPCLLTVQPRTTTPSPDPSAPAGCCLCSPVPGKQAGGAAEAGARCRQRVSTAGAEAPGPGCGGLLSCL